MRRSDHEIFEGKIIESIRISKKTSSKRCQRFVYHTHTRYLPLWHINTPKCHKMAFKKICMWYLKLAQLKIQFLYHYNICSLLFWQDLIISVMSGHENDLRSIMPFLRNPFITESFGHAFCRTVGYEEKKSIKAAWAFDYKFSFPSAFNNLNFSFRRSRRLWIGRCSVVWVFKCVLMRRKHEAISHACSTAVLDALCLLEIILRLSSIFCCDSLTTAASCVLAPSFQQTAV